MRVQSSRICSCRLAEPSREHCYRIIEDRSDEGGDARLGLLDLGQRGAEREEAMDLPLETPEPDWDADVRASARA